MEKGLAVRRGRGAVAGAVAALAMTLAMAALRLATGWPALPELIADWFTAILPPPVFSALLDALKFAAKPLLVAGIVLGQVGVGALLGRAYADQPGWRSSARIVVLAWVATVVVGLPILGAGFFGVATRGGLVGTSLSILLAYAVYGVVLVAVHRLIEGAEGEAEAERRALIARIALGGAGLLALGALAWRLGTTSRSPVGLAPDEAPAAPPPGDPFALRGLPTEITPTSEHYVVSKNFVDPTVDAGTWRLSVEGHVERPFSLTYEDLLALPARTQVYTLECISNEVGGDLMSTARWTGVPLVDLLQRAGVRSGARKVVFHAADGYSDSIPVERALHPDNLLAYRMNDETLPTSHGYPARLLVPGIYGMKNVKWLTRIEVLDREFLGYWQQRGWSDEAVYKTTSRIDVPAARAVLPAGALGVGGVAFSGDRGIARVEVSFDGGRTWQDARLKEALSPYSWVLWALPWDAAPGTYDLVVRATDGRGAVQPATEAPPLPDGASGWHRVLVRVG